MKIIKFCLLLFCLTYLIGCSQVKLKDSWSSNTTKVFNVQNNGLLAETPPPQIIKKLNQQLEQHQPQVQIIFPQPEQILKQTNINIQLEVKDLPIFQDEKSKLGNHVNLILDNEPLKQIYDLTSPVILKDIAPGTHTIRAFAVRPWEESFKNEGAYAQATFSVLTETNNNAPDNNLPLLTYNSPTETYGAEPFLLDFYLTNAPLHSVAQKNPQLRDWMIKATVNGESFYLENWQPIYLKGLNKGENWIQLELVDQEGKSIENVFNNTVRVINYRPETTDILSQIFADKISIEDVKSIIEPTYYIQPVGEPEVIEPSVELEETSSLEKPTISEEATPTEATSVETKTEDEVIPIEKDRESELVPELDSPELVDQTQAESVTIPTPEAIKEAEEKSQIVELAEDNPEESTEISTLIESNPNQETIMITEEDSSGSETVAEVEISRSESVEKTDNEINEIAINLPSAETKTVPNANEENNPAWWKKLLVSLRQKLEDLVKLLPNKA